MEVIGEACFYKFDEGSFSSTKLREREREVNDRVLLIWLIKTCQTTFSFFLYVYIFGEFEAFFLSNRSLLNLQNKIKKRKKK